MKIFSLCMECFKERGIPSFDPFFIDYYDNGIAKLVCSYGHESHIATQSQKFEILLESGVNALLDGYTLEAVSAFSSAHERFLEFFVRFVCYKNKINDEIFESAFGSMSKHSERQLGAFVLLYLIEFNKAYKPDSKRIEFRNKVIHKGYIPDLEEARAFMGSIYDEIVCITNEIKGKFISNDSDDLDAMQFVSLQMQKNLDRMEVRLPVASACFPGFFHFLSGEEFVGFNEAVSKYREYSRMLLSAEQAMERIKKSVSDGLSPSCG